MFYADVGDAITEQVETLITAPAGHHHLGSGVVQRRYAVLRTKAGDPLTKHVKGIITLCGRHQFGSGLVELDHVVLWSKARDSFAQ